MSIITSLLDCDLYKFKMLYFYWKMEMTEQQVTYKLTNRGGINLNKFIDCQDLHNELIDLKNLRLTHEELDILKKYFPDKDFINWLSVTKLGWEYSNGDSFSGTLSSTILYETPIMAIHNELFSRRVLEGMGRYSGEHEYNFRFKLRGKLFQIIDHCKMNPNSKILITEFGTRRRSSLSFQKIAIESMIEILKACGYSAVLTGTSNIMLAEQFGLQAKGTVAHEVPMLYAALAQEKWLKDIVRGRGITHDMYRELYVALQDSQKKFIEDWNKIFPDTYYLTDTYGTEWFLRNCPKDLANFRQDSGSPDLFMDRVEAVFPRTQKGIMFSDGLDVDEILRLRNKYPDHNISFGWGTNLTNDGVIEPLKIVIKLDGLFRYGSSNTVKLSDNPKKAIGKPDDISTYKVAFNYPFSQSKDIIY
jgi:nicotinate phosphoribosyltransferase